MKYFSSVDAIIFKLQLDYLKLRGKCQVRKVVEEYIEYVLYVSMHSENRRLERKKLREKEKEQRKRTEGRGEGR